MKIDMIQKKAKEWKKKLNNVNYAETGAIQVTYQDENGNKRVGYISLTELELKVGNETMTLGELLGKQVDLTEKLKTSVKELESAREKLDNLLKRVKDQLKGGIKK